MKLFYYSFAILGNDIPLLTYASEKKLLIGSICKCNLKNKLVMGVLLAEINKPLYSVNRVVSLSPFHFSYQQLELADFMSKYYVCNKSLVLNSFLPYSNTNLKIEHTLDFVDINSLSDYQNVAFQTILQNRAVLLFGDTGSGKTEIYIQYFIDIVNQGKKALFLLPEIGLTPQMKKRLEQHFNQSVVFWHSKLTKKTKEKNLEKILSGEARVIAGTRSALFLPIDDLGLIIVDEEHDDSYKASSSPRYNARDVALYYANMLDIPIVLGSATPSLNSYANLPNVRLKGTHFKSEKEYFFEQSFDFVSPRMLHELGEVISNKKQAIFFVPTRANYKYLTCNRCGYSYECPYCSVAMSYHKKSNAYKCHYCNYSEAFSKACPKCRIGHLEFNRMGSSEVVEMLRHYFPESVIEKFDRDEVTTEKKLKERLKKFNDNEIDVLVGTQMLSKGHDYHDVNLAIVFGIDTFLHQSDFRSREKAMSLLVQIAGRSGRKEKAKVMIQTFNRDFFEPYLDDYELFLKDELELRQGLYPPYKRFCRLLFAHKNRDKANEYMNFSLIEIQQYNIVEIVGYGINSIEKIANKYRFHILLRADKATDILKVLNMIDTKQMQIDMDPIDFN